MLLPAAANDILLALTAFALVLIPAVIIHELGHFFAAKLVGINVLEFGIGFPPRVGKLFMWGETEFTLNLLPIGGFVRPLGEDMIGPAGEDKVKRDRVVLTKRRSGLARIVGEREMLRLRGVDERQMMSVKEAPPLSRIFFMAAGAIANFITAVLLLFISALIGLSLNVGGLSQIAAIPPGSIFADSQVQVGDVIEKIDGAYFTDFTAFHDVLAEYDGENIEFALLRSETGESYNLSIAPNFGGRAGLIQVLTALEDSPAALAGMEVGDLIVEINHQPVDSASDPTSALTKAAREAEGRPLPLTILRLNDAGTSERLAITVTPRVNPPKGQGRLGIGVRSQFSLADQTRFANAGYKKEMIPQTVPAALSYSLRTTGAVFRMIASIPGQLLDGSLSGEDARPISIIGISKIGGEFLQRSLREGPGLMLHFTALISIFLGLTNLLPIPALDGGRILFVLIEALRGKRIDPKIEARINMISLMLLLGLGVLVMIYDIVNPPSIG